MNAESGLVPVPDLDAKGARPRQRAKREATEASIIDAFGRLLESEGVAGLGVNALIKEASVGKKQVYEYFGGISGVAEAWVKERGIWPPLEEILGESMDSFNRRSPVEKLRIVNRQCAIMLRGNAPLCELMAGEFVQSQEIKEAVLHIRQLVREDFDLILRSDPELSRPEYLALSTIAYAATTYLALRAHCQPNFFGFDLSSEASWQTVLNMYDSVVTNAGAGIDRALDKGD